MKKIFCFAVLALLLASVLAAPKGEFWEKKDYKEWTQKECGKVLEDSPWAKALTLTAVTVGGDTRDNSTDGQQPNTTYRIQLFSAKPIRLATVRQAQIAQKYDSLPAEQKQEMDKRSEAFLSADFSDAVVVNISYLVNNRASDLELARHWQSQTRDVLKNSVYISNSKGEKIYISRYQAGQGAERTFQFIFPRQVDGKPLLNPQDKNLKLEFPYPVIRGMGDGRAFMEFKVDKMIFEGDIAY